MSDPIFDQLDRAARLQSLGVEVRSAELQERAATLRSFAERGGNRQMRRAAAKTSRRKAR